MIAKGSMRKVEINDNSEWVIKRPYDEVGPVDGDYDENYDLGYAANQREIDIFKSNQNNLCLCPIDLRHSSLDELYMTKTTMYNIGSMRENKRTTSLLKQVYNPATLHDNPYEASDLAATLSRLVNAHIIELPAAIDFIKNLEQLYINVPRIFDDLHWQNIGILNKRPVIIDYAGWE